MKSINSLNALKAIALASVVATLSIGAATAGDSTPASFLGKTAPAFTLPDAHGKPISLADYKGEKGTVIIWVSTRCPVSNAYNERMAKLSTSFQEMGFKFVGINSNHAETPEEIAKHAKENNLDFPILKDAENKIADIYGASVTPEVYVVDPQGTLLYHGRIDDSMKASGVTKSDLQEVLAKVSEGMKPEKAESKAFGCTIKRIAKAGM
jgi:peroxiredoxin